MKEEICKRIKNIRTNMNMNKNEFANLLGITPQYLCSIESGANCLSVEKIILLSQKANVSTDYILLGKNNIIDETTIKKLTNINQQQLDNCYVLINDIINLVKKSI